MRYGIDAATLLLIADGSVVVSPAHSLVAPNRVLPDLLGLLLTRVRDGSLAERDALTLHTRATETKIRLLGDRMSRRTAWNLALAQGWDELRDAEYLAVVKLQGDALVASDPRLAKRASGLVPVAQASALAG